jgi:hypothetical protein
MCVHVRVHVYKCRNVGLSGIRSVRYRNEKTNDAVNGPVPDQVKAVRHFLVRYRTEKIDAGIPMPALVFSMPMPSYAHKYKLYSRWWLLATVRLPPGPIRRGGCLLAGIDSPQRALLRMFSCSNISKGEGGAVIDETPFQNLVTLSLLRPG